MKKLNSWIKFRFPDEMIKVRTVGDQKIYNLDENLLHKSINIFICYTYIFEVTSL